VQKRKMMAERLRLSGLAAEDEIKRVVSDLMTAERRSDLAELIAAEVRRYTPYDMMQIAAALRRELEMLPASYRETYSASAHEQIFGTYHRILLMEREGAFQTLNTRIPELFSTFCRMIEEACLSGERSGGAHMTPLGRLLYYLLSAFLIFVLGETGHPIGTPFPGGLRVMMKRGVICCPVREKEDDVPYALCRFCPAEQG
jgi:uncharacterized protein (UPF0305 family)